VFLITVMRVIVFYLHLVVSVSEHLLTIFFLRVLLLRSLDNNLKMIHDLE